MRRPASADVRRLGSIFLAVAVILLFIAFKARSGGSPGISAGHRPTYAFRTGAAAFFAVLGLLCLILGERAAFIHRAWTALGEAMGRVVSPFVLTLLYFLVVTPFGLLFRLRRRDPLGLRPDPEAATYWREPAVKRTDRAGLLRQY
jgi:hypothetical protein